MKKLDFIQEVVKLTKANEFFNYACRNGLRKNYAVYARLWKDGEVSCYLYPNIKSAILAMNDSHENVGNLIVTECVLPLYSSIFD